MCVRVCSAALMERRREREEDPGVVAKLARVRQEREDDEWKKDK